MHDAENFHKAIIDASFDTVNNQQGQTSEMSIRPAHSIKVNKEIKIKQDKYSEFKEKTKFRKQFEIEFLGVPYLSLTTFQAF